MAGLSVVSQHTRGSKQAWMMQYLQKVDWHHRFGGNEGPGARHERQLSSRLSLRCSLWPDGRIVVVSLQ